MTSEILTIQNVNVAYGRQAVLKDVSFAVNAGETFGLIGLNGAGKTSLIKAILSLRPQDSGSIHIFGGPPAEKSARARLAFLPERFEPPWFLSGMEFLKFSLKLYKQTFDEAAIIRAAEKIALDPAALSRRVQTYSKGMRQKLGLMGTVLTNCDLMILDEPMSGLDPLARTLVKDVLIDARKAGRTTFLSSHILADMDEICDRVAIMDEGILKFIGTPDAVRKQTDSENLERAFLHFIEKRMAA
jgi:ABC-2 type transport system ATP-binding protein